MTTTTKPSLKEYMFSTAKKPSLRDYSKPTLQEYSGVYEAPTEWLRTQEVPEILGKKQEPRPRWDEFIDATARGTARVGSAAYEAGAFMEEMPPMTAPGMRPPEPLTESQSKARKQSAMKLRKEADFLWELSKNPGIAAQNKDLASKALNLIGETIPYITATTAGYVTLGPLGGFTVGSMVEGNSAYRNAVDHFKAENEGKPLTPEQWALAKKIGVGVGVVSGSVEAFGGKYAEQLLLKATAKLKTKLAKAGAVFGIGTIVEALEEGTQEIAAITGEETYRDVNWNERVTRTLGAMAGGGFLGGAMRGTSMAGRRIMSPEQRADLKTNLQENGVSPKVAQRATEMLEDGWTPAEVDRNLITPSKFLGDKVLDQIQAKERPMTAEDRQVEREIAEMDREYAEITETPPTVPIPAEERPVAPPTPAEGLELPQKPVVLKPDLEKPKTAIEKGMVEQMDEMAQPVAKAEPATEIEKFGIKALQRSDSLKGISDAEALAIIRAETSEAQEEAVKDILRNRGIDVDKIDIPKYDIRGALTEAEEARPTIKGKKPSHQEAINLAVDEAMKDVVDVVDIQMKEAEPAKVEKQPKVVPQKKTIEDLQAEKDVSDEELSGITKPERRRLIKENAAKIEASDIYQNEVAGLETAAYEVGPGYYYIDKGYRGEVEAIIGKRKGFPTKIQSMFTFNPNEKKIITTPEGKAEVGPTPWELAVQEGLGRYKEGVETTWGEMDISEFVQRAVDSYRAQETIGGVNKLAMERAEESERPDEQLWAEKQRMLVGGFSDQQINEMISEWANEWGIETEDIADEFVNEYGTRIRQIKKMAEPDAALEQLATEQIELEDRQAAVESAREVLEANDIQAEVEQVEEIYEDEVPFERRGRPVGAAITQGQKQVILLAYGADSETGYHEGYHILRRRLTEKSTKVLDKYFKGDEEAEARAFAEFAKTGKTKTFLRGIWQKLLNVLRKVKSGLMGRGFRTAEDIFGAIRKGTVEKQAPQKLVEPTIAYEKRNFKSINDFKNKGDFLQYVKPQLRQRPHPWVPGAKTVRPYVVGYGCDGSTDMNIHYVAQKMARALGIDYADTYITAYPERKGVEQSKAWIEMLKGDLQNEVDEAYKTKKVKDTTIIPDNATIQNVLDDLYDINNRSLENELEERIEKKGISLDKKLKELNLAPAAPERVQFETSGEQARREVDKRARIKARKARLAAQAGIKRRRRGRQAPRIRIKLQDHTPPLRPDLAPLKPEAAEERPLKTRTLTKPVYTEKWFEENLKKERRSVLDKAGSEARRAWMGMEKVFSSSSTRLNNIAPKLFRSTRQYIYDVLTRSTAMTEEVSDFVKASRKMSKADWRQLDLAFKNGIDWKIDQIVAKYNLTEQFQRTRAVLDEIFEAAKEVGIDIDYRKDYWPRILKDPEGFLMYFQGREDWSIIEEAIKRRAKQAGRKIEDLTTDEKAHVVNTLLRGYRTQALTLSRPGPAKERTVESINKELDTFYDDSRTALHKYIKLMNAKIAEREFFGRETKEIQNLRKTQSARLTRLMKLKRRVGLKYPSEPKYKEHISKTAQAWKEGQERLDRLKARPLSETIGGYVLGLQAAGEISPTQEKEIQNILTGIFDPQRMGSRMGLFATGVYIDTLNSPLQALTQLDEFAYSFYRSPLRSVPAAIRTAARKSKITPRDIGITSIGEEFQGPTMKRGLSLLLKSTGFEMIDRLNKENYINTVLSKYQAQAKRKTLKADFVKRLRKVFGNEYKGVIEDLRNNRISDNVKYLLFNEILDIQPIAITEMPEAYNKAGNMRILYSLKTFYMKRLDFIRNECFKDMKSPKTFAKGFGKLVWLASAFALLGAGSDFLKDFIKGKPFDLKDSITDNLLRMAFFSKYQAWRTREKGLGTALLEGWRPPTKAIDAITRDIINEAQGKERGFELWRSVPIGGEFYYWWFGEGRRKIERKEGKTAGAAID